MNDYLALFLGLVLAVAGGELFIRGSVGLAQWARIAPGIIGATVAAFATSSPELAVAVTSGIAKEPEIALGGALGSNVVNVGAIMGIALLMNRYHVSQAEIRRDFTTALLAPLLLLVFALDGVISRIDGILLGVFFIVWLIATIIEVKKQRSSIPKFTGEKNHLRVIIFIVLGLIALIEAGILIVKGASSIAISFGISSFVISATIVAIGTSLPEMATLILSRLKGHSDIGLGTILGSNIFNGLFIISVAAIIYPIQVPRTETIASLILGVLLVVLTFPNNRGIILRRKGFMLIALYVIYVGVVLQIHPPQETQPTQTETTQSLEP